MRWTPVSLIRAIGLMLCGSSILITLLHPATEAPAQSTTLLGALFPWLSATAVAAFCLLTPLLMGAMLWWCTGNPDREKVGTTTLLLLAAQTGLSLLVSPELQFLVAVEAGLLLAPRWGAAWVTAQALLSWLAAIGFPTLMEWAVPPGGDAMRVFLWTCLFMLVAMLYNFFAFGLGWFAATERRQARALDLTNRSLERANAELMAAQKAASETARLQERLSIARELHDAIGHQLTALSLNLQVASHLSTDKAREPVLEAYALTGQLLQEVRSVVGSMRDPVPVDFVRAAHAFAFKIQRPKVHLDLVELPDAGELGLSHCLLRCIQEIATNAVRHAEASNLWIQSAIREGWYELRARDDGRGTARIEPGHGLRGMEERIRDLEGELALSSGPERGFDISIRLPLEGREQRLGAGRP